ncbi:thioesterase family protein [Gordonia sp. (in: high G+C Gram-positive bacteria)]|uniref:thioesterase family protein n=1 Tax=Gordonia sp. (in: high G+C Gram-positive bacteria) TaxID=84139 RepID=UPI00169FF502|nr:thioesterase family protein [Gordonia sp. (in: high G+C Gram-positive bacteria)]NLG45552.1 thioesterase family protein [Gordonia sp. (in: high G+C Gram-positive bacteria)]
MTIELSPTTLDSLITLDGLTRGSGDAAYRGNLDPTFTIGPKVHGGSIQMMIAAAARRALSELADPADEVAVIAIASDFLAAPDPAPVELHASLIKTGRTVSLMRVDVRQNDRLMVTSTVTLGRPDHGDARFRGPTPVSDLDVAPPADAPGLYSTSVGEVVHLGAAIEVVLDMDHFPALRGETGEPLVRGWTRPKAADVPATVQAGFPVLVCDLSPPVVMNLGMFGWAPTVQLTTYVSRVPAAGWLRFAASAQEVGQGMFAEDHVVVDATGATVAQSRQLALIPAAR